MEEIERKKEMKEKLQNIREEALKAIQSADVPENSMMCGSSSWARKEN